MIEIQEIEKILPHRYPFLLVDRILELEPSVSAVGLKNVTVNEPFFQGHFPGHPIMPGVLLIESMAQVAGVLALKSAGGEDKVLYFMGIDKARFRRPVVPGDTLHINVKVLKIRGPIWSCKGRVTVGGELAVDAGFMATVMDA
ncbi:MAG: 3-hydroxyacyl-ACP dehydratase FabZ [Thermodesulfobacteriota bacterium]